MNPKCSSHEEGPLRWNSPSTCTRSRLVGGNAGDKRVRAWSTSMPSTPTRLRQPGRVPVPVGRGAARRSRLQVLRRSTRSAGTSACAATVFQPIGFDAFGIHTENYALKVGEHPKTLTARTTASFRAPTVLGGMAWDWSRAIDTSRSRRTTGGRSGCWSAVPGRADVPGRGAGLWCPSCLTVLAREQTEDDGTCASAAGRPSSSG